MDKEKIDTEKDIAQTATEEKTGETQEQEAPAESENLTEQLQQCQLTLAEWQEKYARLTADLDNYKKRTIKERSAWAETAQMPLLVDLLAIVDNFDRAMEHQIEDVPEEMRSWVDGMQMIHAAFKDFLKNAGVQEVLYKQFNPEYHEALLHVDSAEHDAGAIVEVMEKGYVLNDRVLRPAKVSVAK